MSQWDFSQLRQDANRQTLVKLGFTAILLGYLLVWVPHDVAGLSFIGLEVGEWIKFLPQIRSGQIAIDRNLFYLPPITLGLMMALWTAGWPKRRWKTLVMRLLAVMVALLAFPSVEAILNEGADQWLGRAIMVAFVVVIAAFASLLNRLPRGRGFNIGWGLTFLLAITGLVLPSWAYLSVRPAIAQLFVADVGIGPGLWLNGFGHLLIAVVSLSLLLRQQMMGRDLQG